MPACAPHRSRTRTKIPGDSPLAERGKSGSQLVQLLVCDVGEILLVCATSIEIVSPAELRPFAMN
jgi:hypothetical protein